MLGGLQIVLEKVKHFRTFSYFHLLDDPVPHLVHLLFSKLQFAKGNIVNNRRYMLGI